jgi:hypothetical protein
MSAAKCGSGVPGYPLAFARVIRATMLRLRSYRT